MRHRLVLILILAAALARAPTRAQELTLFAPAPAVRSTTLPPPGTVRERFVAINLPALSRQRDARVTIELFDGVRVTASLDRIDVRNAGSFTWTGSIDGRPGCWAAFAVEGTTMAGQITLADAVYELRFSGKGDVHVLRQVDVSRLPPDADPLRPIIDLQDVARSAATTRTDDGSLIDLMVVWTAQARAAQGGTTAAVQALASLAVANGNTAFAASGVAHRWRLVYSGEVDYTESTDAVLDLGRLRSTSDGFLDGVHALRDSTRADVVALLVADLASACGIGYLMTTNSTAFAPYAFSVTRTSCVTGQTLTHEVGHNMGLNHDSESSGGVFPYGRGYVDATNNFRTIMATNGNPQPRINHHSNPAVSYNGSPTGIVDSRDEARALDGVRVAVSNFRSACGYTISPTSRTFDAGGGTGSVAVTTTESACAWSATSGATWITFTSSGGTGSGTATYTVAPNTTTSGRSATLTIAGQTFTVTQTGVSALPTLSVSVTGSGSVASIPGGISCGTDCSEPYASGTTVSLTPAPAAGWAFAGWSGSTDCYDSQVLVTAATTCTALFTSIGASQSSRLVDINGEGGGDAFLYNAASGAWSMAFSTGSGFNFANSAWSAGWTVAPGHFNGDNLIDFFLYNSSTGAWTQALNNAAGAFSYTSGNFSSGWQVHVGRFNGDGLDDVLVYNPQAGGAVICHTNGAGSFGSFRSESWSAGWDVRLARLNSDALTDVFLYSRGTGHWFRSVNTGSGFAYTTASWSPQWTTTIADFNGDGLDDVFLYMESGGQWFQCLNNGTDFTYTAATWSPGSQIRRGHLNQDGREDLFVYNPSTGAWTQCFSDGAGGFSRYVSGTWSTGWNVSLPDLNRDTIADVFLYAAATGQYFQFVTSSAGGFAGSSTGFVSAGYTVIAAR